MNAPVPMIIIPDAGTLQASKYGSLPLPSLLSPEATISTIVSGFKIYYFLSLGELSCGGCNVLLKEQKYIRNKVQRSGDRSGT